MKKTKKRNKQDATLINVRAAKKRSDTLEKRVMELEEFVVMFQVVATILIKRLDALEKKKRGRG